MTLEFTQVAPDVAAAAMDVDGLDEDDQQKCSAAKAQIEEAQATIQHITAKRKADEATPTHKLTSRVAEAETSH